VPPKPVDLDATRGRSIVHPNAGLEAAVQIISVTESGDRGSLLLTPGTGAAPGGGTLATVHFYGPMVGGRIHRATRATQGDGLPTEIVGDLAAEDVRPIVLTSYPAPPENAWWVPAPLFADIGLGLSMVGFEVQIRGLGNVALGRLYVVSWAVL
jgi:hypothetical protein